MSADGMETELNLLLPIHGQWIRDVGIWIEEDFHSFDYGGFVVGSEECKATLYCKQQDRVIVLCGIPFIEEVCKQTGLLIEWQFNEGSTLEVPRTGRLVVAFVLGPVNRVLAAERLILNILSRASGIASASFLAAQRHGRRIAGTRKTTPGFRRVEKYAMLVGGIDAHRYDSSSMVMLKDNHIAACHSSIEDAVKRARKAAGFTLKVEVECQTQDEAMIAIKAGADVVMLDNFSPAEASSCARQLRSQHPNREFLIEISGGLTLEDILLNDFDDIDVISTSAVHQGVQTIDFSLKIEY